MNVGEFLQFPSWTTYNANWQFPQSNQLGQYLCNFIPQPVQQLSKPAEAQTNVDWLRRRVNEMRVRL